MKAQVFTILIALVSACGGAAASNPVKRSTGTLGPASGSVSGWNGISHLGNTAFDVVQSN